MKDKLTMLKGVGRVVGKRLEEHGLVLVEDLFNIKDDEQKKEQATRTIKGLKKNAGFTAATTFGSSSWYMSAYFGSHSRSESI